MDTLWTGDPGKPESPGRATRPEEDHAAVRRDATGAERQDLPRIPGRAYPPKANISTFGRSLVAALRSSE